VEEQMTLDIESMLSEYIRTQVLKRPKYILGIDDALISSGLIDSFHLVDLALFVEEKFGVRIEDTELNASSFDSITQLNTLIQERQEKEKTG
jgi:acyl carrier protein